MHAPSRFPSLHRTPGPLSVPPFHLHLKGRRPRRLSLCSLPHSRNDLIYLSVNGNMCLGRGIPPPSDSGGSGRKKRDLWQFLWFKTQHPSPSPITSTNTSTNTVTVFDSCDAGDFLPRTHVGGQGSSGTTQSKSSCVLLRCPVPTFDGA